VTVQDVNRLLKQFDEAKQLVKQVEGMGKRAQRFPKGGLKWP